MEVGRPPEGCKVMKAASRPPGIKTHVQDLYCPLGTWYLFLIKGVINPDRMLMNYHEGKPAYCTWGV